MIFTFKRKEKKVQKSKITKMTGKLFFTADGAGVHLGPTNFWDFALILFGKLMLLLIPCTWNAYLFQILA